MKKIMKNRQDKNYEIIQESASQISEEKQYIKYDTRDYVVGYLVK